MIELGDITFALKLYVYVQIICYMYYKLDLDIDHIYLGFSGHMGNMEVI